MNWTLAHRYDKHAISLFDRHYSRRSSSKGGGVVGPYRHVVLTTPRALWVSVDELYARSWRGAWRCSVFRNESDVLSSDLIREAVAATVAAWGPLPLAGIVTHVDAGAVRRKRDPGRCYLRAGWRPCGETRGASRVPPLAGPSATPGPSPRDAARLVLSALTRGPS